jgi:hypothetical protein
MGVVGGVEAAGVVEALGGLMMGGREAVGAVEALGQPEAAS